MPLPGGYLLDTNIVLALLRQNALGKYLDATYGLLAPPQPPLVCIVTVGEMLSLANQFGWGAARRAALDALLAPFTQVDVSSPRTCATYGEVDAWSIARGRRMGKNDVWIAAASRETNSTILTTDTDFDLLHGRWVDREWVDPTSKPSP